MAYGTSKSSYREKEFALLRQQYILDTPQTLILNRCRLNTLRHNQCEVHLPLVICLRSPLTLTLAPKHKSQVHPTLPTYSRLKLQTTMAAKFKLVFFVPVNNAERVKDAVFATGAGSYPGPGQYTECCWQTVGTGQFRPGKTAVPHIGKVGELE